MLQSLEVSGLKPGQWAVFPGGGGGLGSQGVQLAKAMGLRAIAIDTGDDKRDLCIKLGAEAFVDFKKVANVAEEVIKVADGIGAHGVFVTAPQAYKDAIAYTGGRVEARVMCIGLRKSFITSDHSIFLTIVTAPTGTVLLGTDPAQYVLQGLKISGTIVGSMNDTDKALDYARRVSHCDIIP
jgi:propanol-preferring alcohol dehydrogenase